MYLHPPPGGVSYRFDKHVFSNLFPSSNQLPLAADCLSVVQLCEGSGYRVRASIRRFSSFGPRRSGPISARRQSEERRLCHIQLKPFGRTTGRLPGASSPPSSRQTAREATTPQTSAPLKGLEFSFSLNPAGPSAVLGNSPCGWMVVDRRNSSSVPLRLCGRNSRSPSKDRRTLILSGQEEYN